MSLQPIRLTIPMQKLEHALLSSIREINNRLIHCGCMNCLFYNYPLEPENQFTAGFYLFKPVDGVIFQGKKRVSVKEENYESPKIVLGALNSVNNCHLYQFFKDMCAKFHLPLPDSDIDNPGCTEQRMNLLKHFGMSNVYQNDSKAQEECWAGRIAKLPPDQKITSWYRFVYEMDRMEEEMLNKAYGIKESVESTESTKSTKSKESNDVPSASLTGEAKFDAWLKDMAG